MIVLSMLVYKPSTELASYKIVLRICIMSSYIFRSMEYICDRNGLIHQTRIKLFHLLVTSIRWLDQTSIVQDNFHLQWHHDRGIWFFFLRNHTCPAKILQGIFERFCINFQDRAEWHLNYFRIAIYHWLLFCFLRLSFNLQCRLILFQ